MEKYLRTMDWVYRISIWISGTAIVIMSLAVPWGIYARKVLGAGSSWPEPVSIYCMVTFTFLGAAATYRACGHIAVDLFVSRVPQKVQRIMAYLVHACMMMISVFIMIYGFNLCKITWNQAIAELPWLNVGWGYLPLPLGSAITLLFIIEHVIAGPQNNRPIVTIDHHDETKDGGL